MCRHHMLLLPARSRPRLLITPTSSYVYPFSQVSIIGSWRHICSHVEALVDESSLPWGAGGMPDEVRARVNAQSFNVYCVIRPNIIVLRSP
jgi:hypothetical protein